jgi:hypothetical protein
VAQARDYPKSTKNRNQPDSINFTSLHHHSLGATRRTKAAAIFQQNKQRQRPSYAHASALLANERNKGETELRTNTGHQSTQHHGNSLQTLPQNLPPIPPSARSRSTATRARTRHYTASLLLLNKRVRGVVHGGNGLLHLRPRESTYSARECSTKHRHELWSSKRATSRQQFANLTPKSAPNRLPLAHH